MIRLMVIDDEPIVIEGIRHIEWIQYGIEIVATAANGQEAYRKALAASPDILLCDIHMPVEDGLSFVKKLRQALPAARVIMLTGYNDKQYLLSSIQNGVCDYLIKPVSSSQIIASVLRAKQEILRDKKALNEQEQFSQLISENAVLLQARLLHSIFHGQLSSKEAFQKAELLQIPFRGPAFSLLTGKRPQRSEWIYLYQKLSLILSEFEASMILPVEGEVYIVLSLTQRIPPNVFHRIAAQLQQCINELLIYVEFCPCYEEIPEKVRQIEACMRRDIWFRERSLISAEKESFGVVSQEKMNEYEAALSNAVRLGDAADAAAWADKLALYLEEQRPPTELYREMIAHVVRHCRLIQGNIALPEPCETPEEARKQLLSACQAEEEGYRSGSGQVDRILRYVEAHSAEALTLEQLAAALYLSPTYLSRILGDKTNRGFVGWLNYFRVQKAKDLLQNMELKNYEIAEQVGYHSYKIFAEHFIKEVGMSAKEYRYRRKEQKKGSGRN